MDNFLSVSVLWFVIGFAFFLLEFVIPGFILFFFGIAAWIVALLSLFVDIDINVQLLVFLGTALTTVALFRKWLRAKLGTYSEGPQILEDEFIGKTAIAETPIAAGKNGKVDFKGTSWDACSEDTIAAGQNVLITGTRSIILIVKPI